MLVSSSVGVERVEKMAEESDYYECKGCNGVFITMDAVPDHDCFREENVVTNELEEALEKIQNSVGSTEIPKQNAAWPRQSTLALLNLYKDHRHLDDNPKKKTKLWEVIAEKLAYFGIEVTSNQVRWKWNYLCKRYKECVDNNQKSGRSHMTFEYYDFLEEILGHEKAAVSTYTVETKINSVEPRIKKKKKEKESTLEPSSSRSNTGLQQIGSSQSTSTNGNKSPSEKRKRPLHGSGSQAAKKKADVFAEWSHHLENVKTWEENRQAHNQKMYELQKQRIEELKTIATQKKEARDRKNEKLVKIEKKKLKLFEKMFPNKENIESSSDSD